MAASGGRQNLFTNWSETLHIPWTYVLDADLRPGGMNW